MSAAALAPSEEFPESYRIYDLITYLRRFVAGTNVRASLTMALLRATVCLALMPAAHGLRYQQQHRISVWTRRSCRVAACVSDGSWLQGGGDEEIEDAM